MPWAIAFSRVYEVRPRLYVRNADGTGELVELTGQSMDAFLANYWSPDGSTLAFTCVYSADRGPTQRRLSSDIGFLAMNPIGQPRMWFETAYREGGATFSPDGKWIAYTSDEPGRMEVFVRPFDAV